MTLLESRCKPSVVVGVDTHKETHHAAVLGDQGALLEVREFPADTAGYAELADWIEGFGQVGAVGVESSGTYGAGLTRFLRERCHDVLEINQPHHHTRARVGKDDAIDAEAAARKVLSGSFTVQPKDTTGIVESIRMLQVARRSAVKSRTIALNQFQGVLVTAPAALRESIKGRWTKVKVRQCAALRPDLDRLCEPLQAAKVALRSICRRIQDLDEEVALLDAQLHQLVGQVLPLAPRPGRHRRAPRRTADRHRGREPGPPRQRGSLRPAVRRRSSASILGQDKADAPPQGWRPPGEPGTAPHRRGAAPL